VCDSISRTLGDGCRHVLYKIAGLLTLTLTFISDFCSNSHPSCSKIEYFSVNDNKRTGERKGKQVNGGKHKTKQHENAKRPKTLGEVMFIYHFPSQISGHFPFVGSLGIHPCSNPFL
jgi:hypothetical protein